MIIPAPLIDDIDAGKCVPFIGAGFSMNAAVRQNGGMPDWSGLTQTLAHTADVSPDIGGPAVASAFERKFGRVQLIEAIRQALHADDVEPGPAHMAFAELPFDTIYTTNFDLLLEDSFLRARRPFRSIVGELQMPFHGGPLATTIVKMHGDLRHEEHVIVTTEDYDRYLDEYPVIATHLSAQLMTRTALFVGYSLSDPDFLNIRKVVKSRLGKFERMAYVIAFDTALEEIEKELESNLHVISLATTAAASKGEVLSIFFGELQERIDTRGGTRFRASRPEAFEDVSRETFERSAQTMDASSLFTGSSNLCFVMMSFTEETDWVYRDFIKPVAEQFGLSVVRADNIYAPGSITEQIRVAIQQSRLCIADVTGKNPNVLYEVGIAHTLGKPTLLLTREVADAPFDLRSLRLIVYDEERIQAARLELERGIQHVLGKDRLDEAKRLIDGGMSRAAAAVLGVFLEHSLRRLQEKYDRQLDIRHGQRPLGLGRSLRLLAGAGIVEHDDVKSLQRVIEIRNRAVHDLSEPSFEDVQSMLVTLREFVRKYLGDVE
jgi:hypothetical protein